MQPCAIMRRHINLKKNSPGFHLANIPLHPLYLQWVYFFLGILVLAMMWMSVPCQHAQRR